MIDLDGQFITTAGVERSKDDTDERLFLKVYNNQFVALVLEPGVYSYEFAAKDFTRWAPTHSPSRLIKFEVSSGNAKYVGDLVLSLEKKVLTESKNLFGQTMTVVNETVEDYDYKVETDFNAASNFYEGIKNKPNIPLTLDVMLNQEL